MVARASAEKFPGGPTKKDRKIAKNGSTPLDRKRIYANSSAYPNPNPKAQLCFRTNEMTSFFDQV